MGADNKEMAMERITPIDIERAELPLAFRGYSRARVDELLKQCAGELGHLLNELKKERDALKLALQELDRFRAEEQTLKEALVVAQKAADETRANAHKESELIVERARMDAERTTAELRAETERLKILRQRLESELTTTVEAIRAQLMRPSAAIELEVRESSTA